MNRILVSAFACLVAIVPAFAQDGEKKAPESRPESRPAAIERVGGDLKATVDAWEGKDGTYYKSGACTVTTPLPEGYPRPTPPGAIEIKTYPPVRRAEVSGTKSPDSGMNSGFWPLFMHIQKNGIEMTSPVEMDLEGVKTGEKLSADRWTMSFLYREPTMGKTGADGNVKVVDRPATTVLALGTQGSYGVARLGKAHTTLLEWLKANPGWETAGDPRTFSYNGPDVANSKKWGEIQIPIRRVGSAK